MFVGAWVAVGGTKVAVGAPVEDGGGVIREVGVRDGVGVGAVVGGVSPGRRVLVGGNVDVGMKPPPPSVGAAEEVGEGVELGPPAAIRVASTAANTVA